MTARLTLATLAALWIAACVVGLVLQARAVTS